MTSQKSTFLSSEADQWYARNKKAYEQGSQDHLDLTEIFAAQEIDPKRILEVGCSNGARLQSIRQRFQCESYGIDPSATAIADGAKLFPDLKLSVGTADQLDYPDDQFDVIVFGFCLYLCDRKDLFTIAREANRCLKDQGYLVIKDFAPPVPFKNAYTHKEGLFSYKMDYASMFTWNPAYTRIFSTVTSHAGKSMRGIPNEKIGVTILHKNEQMAYPTEPYKTI